MNADHTGSALARPMPGRPRTGRAHEIEHRILDAAGVLFLQQGYARTTYEQLAKEAHTSKTTLYSRFPTKPELFSAVIRQRLAVLRERVVVGSGTGTPQERVIEMATQLADATLSSPSIELMRITAAESKAFPELAREGFRIAFGQSVQSITAGLVEVAPFTDAESARPWAERFVDTALLPLYMHALFGEDLAGLRARARRDISQVAAALFSQLEEDHAHSPRGV